MSRVQLLGKKPIITNTPLMSVGSSRVRLLDEKTTIPPSTISPENKTTLDKYMSKGIRTARAKQLQNEMTERGQATYPTEPITIPSREKQNFFSGVSEGFTGGLKAIGKAFLGVPKSFLKEVVVPTFEDAGKLIEKIDKGYTPTSDELFENLPTREKAKAFSKEMIKGVAQLPRDFISGQLSTITGTLGHLERFGWDKTKPVADKIDEWIKQIAPEDPNFANTFVSGVGSMSIFYLPGMGVAKGTSLLTGLSPKLANWAGNSAMTLLESSMEAGNVYRTLKKQGLNEEEIKRNSDIDFGINIALLTLTNKFDFTGDIQRTLVKAIKQRLFTGGREAIQELGQQVASNLTTYKKWDEGIKEAGIMGGLLGFMAGGGANPNININIQTQEEIIDLIKKAKKSQEGFTKIPGSRVPVMGKKEIITKAIPDKLTEQAKKYKSAEEFVKSQKPFFRATDKKFDAKLLTDDGLFVSPKRSVAERYLEEGRILDKLYIKPSAKILTFKNTPKKFYRITKDGYAIPLDEGDGIEIAKYAKSKGFDIVEYGVDPQGLVPESAITNKNIVLTKPQLKDIWNKAQKIKPESQISKIKEIIKKDKALKAVKKIKLTTKAIPNKLTEQAKKYKSAEEFVKAQGKPVYHGTNYANARMIQREGINPKNANAIQKWMKGKKYSFFNENEKYAQSYGIQKGGGNTKSGRSFVLAIKSPKDIQIEQSTFKKGMKFPDLISQQKISPEDIYIKGIDNKWYPIKEFNFFMGEPNTFIGRNGLKELPIKTKSQLKDIWNKAKASEIKPTTKKVKKRRKTGKEQLAEREEIKTKREEIKTKKKALTFYEEDFENQYQNFKKLKNKDAEDIEQLKSKNKNISATEIDNILYSQEKTGDEVFDMFTERLAKEKESVLPKIPKETKAVIREKAVSKIKTAKEILDRRRVKIRAVRDHFNLTDIELKSITQRDIRLMSNIEFKQFIDNIRIKAEKLSIKRQAMNELLQQIKDKELNVENLRKAMKLPTMKNMTVDDIHKLDEALMPFQKGDEFLSVRKLETVDRTELKGIKTWREARERLAKKLNVPIEKLQNIKVSEFDRFRYDTGLAERNPFYKMMVEEPAKKMLMSETEYLKIEKKTLALAKKLKQKGLIGRLIPQQKNIREFMETPIEKRGNIEMTQAEIDLAEYMTQNFDEARNYLVMVEAMKMGKDNYFTHIRRGILEAVKEDGLIKAVKEVFTQYKLEEQAFDILDKQTGEILAMDKFFKFAMHRTGGLIPTENTVKAFLSYMKTFKKKQALDEIVPLVDIYAHSITPKGLTEKGLLLHGNLITFVKEWLNMKKGRHITLIAKQNGRIDGALRAIKMFTSLRDLGLNIPVSLTTEVGEQITTYQLLGKKKYVAGKIRQNTKQGKKIIEKYRNLVGKNPWKELVEPSKNIGDRLMEGLFIMFRDSSERANRTFLLGSLSKQEFKAGEISPDRLSALRTELGKYRMVEGMKSIIGATPEGKAYTQYKTWAIPALRTTIKNLSNVGKKITGQKIGSKEWKKSLLELYRLVEITAFAMLMFSMVRDEDDDSFVGKIINKGYNEATTLIQALSPRMFLAAGRTASFVEDLGISLTLILLGEKYKTTDKYKGVEKLKRQFKPVVISQFKRKEEKKTTSTIRRRKRTPRVRRRRK